MADITASIGGGYSHSFNYVWDVNTLEAVRMTQPGGVGGGGDATAANQVTGNASLASIDAKLTDPLPISVASIPTHAVTQSGTWNIGSVTTLPAITFASPQAVTGTFWQATQPISAAALPLPSNAAAETGGNLATIAAKDFATSAKQDTGTTALGTLLTELQAKTEPADQQHVIVDTMPAVSAETSGLVSDATEQYTPGDTQPLSLTTDGRLRVATADESHNFAPWGTPEAWRGEPMERGAISAW